MSLRRVNPRRDANEPVIVAALEACGCHVERISGAGIPDLLVSRAGRWHVVEVKTARGKLKPAQIAFRDRARAPVAVLRTLSDVEAWVAALG